MGSAVNLICCAAAGRVELNTIFCVRRSVWLLLVLGRRVRCSRPVHHICCILVVPSAKRRTRCLKACVCVCANVCTRAGSSKITPQRGDAESARRLCGADKARFVEHNYEMRAMLLRFAPRDVRA